MIVVLAVCRACIKFLGEGAWDLCGNIFKFSQLNNHAIKSIEFNLTINFGNDFQEFIISDQTSLCTTFPRFGVFLRRHLV